MYVCHVLQVSQQTLQWMEARSAAMLVGIRRQLGLMYKFSERYVVKLRETWPITVCCIRTPQGLLTELGWCDSRAGVFGTHLQYVIPLAMSV